MWPVGVEPKPVFFTHGQSGNDFNQIWHIDFFDGRGDIFEAASKLVQGFGRGIGCKISHIPLTSPLASNTAYCATAHTRENSYFIVLRWIVIWEAGKEVRLRLRDCKISQRVRCERDYKVTWCATSLSVARRPSDEEICELISLWTHIAGDTHTGAPVNRARVAGRSSSSDMSSSCGGCATMCHARQERQSILGIRSLLPSPLRQDSFGD